MNDLPRNAFALAAIAMSLWGCGQSGPLTLRQPPPDAAPASEASEQDDEDDDGGQR